jgi:hypothetical protein
MTKHFDLKFAASMKLVKARAWRLLVVPPGTSPVDPQPAAINHPDITGYLARDRTFESISLQQTVSLSPAAAFGGSRNPLFRAVWAAGLATGSAENAPGFPLGANQWQCLCRAIFQYRSAADAVGGNATTSERNQEFPGFSVGSL